VKCTQLVCPSEMFATCFVLVKCNANLSKWNVLVQRRRRRMGGWGGPRQGKARQGKERPHCPKTQHFLGSAPKTTLLLLLLITVLSFILTLFCFPSWFGRLCFNVFEVFETHTHTHETTSSSLFHYQISKLGRVPKFIDSILGGGQAGRWLGGRLFVFYFKLN
jgi:hypothetical protein